MWLPVGNTIMRCGSAPAMSAGETAIRAGNTVAWYDFADATTLTDDGGGLISSWRDKLLSGHDLLAATTARPLLQATGILFDGAAAAGDYMKCASFTWNQPEFIYMVLRQITFDLFSCSARIFDGNTFNVGCFFQHNSSGTPNLAAYAGALSADNANLALNTFGILRLLFNGVNSSVQVNNTTKWSGNLGASNMAGFTLGADGGNASWSNIEVKEIVLRNIVDTTNETNIYNYLATKYGFATI